jgi:hypothetical protein
LLLLLSEDPHEVDFEFGYGLDPHPPVDQLEEGGLEEVEFLKAHTADIGYEVVPVKDVVIEF